jgi:hypothetical protein
MQRLLRWSVAVVVAFGPSAARAQPPPAEDACPPMLGALDLPTRREASGTAWQPDITPLFAAHERAGCWDFVQQLDVFAGYDMQLGPRGDRAFVAPGYYLVTTRRRLDHGELRLRAMTSLEPFTVAREGMPQLFQIGASRPDHRRPRDATQELSLQVSAPLGESGLAFLLYVAAAGEPALGAPSSTLRFSAMASPFVPLGAQAEEARVAYGVITAGFFTRHLKLEGSYFNGRAPGPGRAALPIDLPDSLSARLTVQPLRFLSVQVSHGYLRQPEARAPLVSSRRTTGSVLLQWPLDDEGSQLGATLAWGRDAPSLGPSRDSLLAEATLIAGGNEIFARGEIVTRSAGELSLPGVDPAHTFPIRALSTGYVHSFGPYGALAPGLGLSVAVQEVAPGLTPFYGKAVPAGGMVFLRLRPGGLGAELGPSERSPHR